MSELTSIYGESGTSGGVTEAELNARTPSTIVYVKTASDMPSTPSSDVTYWIDYAGLLEVSEIIVPSGGLFLRGTQSNMTGIGSTADNFTLFNGASAGDIFMKDLFVTTSGTGSSVYDVTSADGAGSVELIDVNYQDCTSLGELTSYNQYSFISSGIFGGSPELTLSGDMNGIFIDTALTADLDSSFTGSLFKAGTDLLLSSRFRSNMRVDLPTSASFCDFSSANFNDSSLCQMNGGQYSRNGVVSSGDNQFFPNLDPDDLVCEWRDNNGLRNTHEGGTMTLTSESTTTISVAGDFYDVAGAWTAEDLQHFNMDTNGQLQNEGKSPQEFMFNANLYVDGGANDVLSVKLVRWNSADSVFEDVHTQTQQVLSIIGGRDVAIINLSYPILLEQNDYAKLQVANVSDTTNVVLEVGSFAQATKRS